MNSNTHNFNYNAASSMHYINYCSALLMDPNTSSAYRALGALVVALYHKTHEGLSISIEGNKRNSSTNKQANELTSENVFMFISEKNGKNFSSIRVEMFVNISNVAEFIIELYELDFSVVFLSTTGELVKDIDKALWVLANEDPIRFGARLAETIASCGVYHLKQTSGLEQKCSLCSGQLVCLSKPPIKS